MSDLTKVQARIAEITASLPTEAENASAASKKVTQLRKELDDLNTVVALEGARQTVAALEGKLSGKTEGKDASASQPGNAKGWRRILPHRK